MATLPKWDEARVPASRPTLVWTKRKSSSRAVELEHELSRNVKGEVRFDAASRSLYATDLSIYRQVPIGVVIPRDADDVIAAVAACRKFGVPILGRGCGTSLSGQCCNVAVVIDFSKYMNNIEGIDLHHSTASVQPGVICDQLRHAANGFGLTLAPDPATHQYCTLGGMIGNNSCGAHSLMGGKTVDNVEELEILTYDGTRMRVGKTSPQEFERIVRAGGRKAEIYARLREIRDRYAAEVRRRYPRIPRRVSGYNLDELLPENGFHVARALVGSESTLAIVLSAKVRLVRNPAKRALLVVGYPDLGTAGDHVPEILHFEPTALEAFHKHVVDNMKLQGKKAHGAGLLPEGNVWMLIEFGGETQREANARAEAVIRKLRKLPGDHQIKLFEREQDQNALWHIRESGVGASRLPNREEAWPSWEDTAVEPEKLGSYLREFSDLVTRRFNYTWTVFGHFGQGCVHARIAFDLKTVQGVAKFRRFMEEGADLVVRYGGSLSGEHGDGQAKGELLPKMFGPELMQAFREFKAAWDPQWMMNPGKLIDAYPMDEDIRVGPDYKPRPVFTHFQFPEDKGSFAVATERCFGVGKCRSLQGDTMCPSFRATREEKHSTRGRARLLFEMLRGDSIMEGWRDEGVKDALDLCLGCKGCKGDCPVSVDLATYKAEFLSHYWEGKVRPRHAYAFGMVDAWARIGSPIAGLANLVTQTPALSEIAKAAAGIAPQRSIPPLAPRSFQQWFRKRRPPYIPTTRQVVLWPDTFTNYFHPDIAQAAVEVLENAGFQVRVPDQPVCCGRPLYDFGMLDRAKAYLHNVIQTLRQEIRDGIPIVVLEPSCASVFRDEMRNLLPRDEDARRFSQQAFLLGEFLDRHAPSYSPPPLRPKAKALVHGHCHQKALMGMDPDVKWLSKLDLDVELIDSGCCGMAGSFGFEKEKYEVSVKCGEHALLGAVRGEDSATWIVSNGFSCQEQISQLTKRHAVHMAQLMAVALKQKSTDSNGHWRSYPERSIIEAREQAVRESMLHAGAGLGAALAVGAGLLWAAKRAA
ncbi:MAG TPA: FAD-linked oxidase C-terminal domain-containing protein [Candidatus Angelobacter sp.]|nr:FAD-linked oxidase C-terminal domain-containing protein [Candidatus Angelobacter sp.]